jgi:hypothetical protein
LGSFDCPAGRRSCDCTIFIRFVQQKRPSLYRLIEGCPGFGSILSIDVDSSIQVVYILSIDVRSSVDRLETIVYILSIDVRSSVDRLETIVYILSIDVRSSVDTSSDL